MDKDEVLQDYKTQDAVVRNIEILGEAVKLLSDETKEKVSKYSMERHCQNKRQVNP